jgi:hypothetical protein
MAKDAFNSVAGTENKVGAPGFPSGFLKQDKNGRIVKNEVDFRIGTFQAPDGRRIPVRNGKPLAPLYEMKRKDQEEKHAGFTSDDERGASGKKQAPDRNQMHLRPRAIVRSEPDLMGRG